MSDNKPGEPGLFQKHFGAGKQAYEAGQLEEAERNLEEACLLRPRDNKSLNLLGLLYFKQEKYEKAEEVYRRLAAGSPEAHTLFYNLGLIYLKLSRLDDAEQAFAKALAISRDNPKINFYLGSIYEKQRRFQDAIFQYRQAGANIMVRRVEDKLEPEDRREKDPTPAARPAASPKPRPTSDTLPFLAAKSVKPVSDAVLAESAPVRPKAPDEPPAAKAESSSIPPPAKVAPAPAVPSPLPARRSTDIVSFLAGMPPPTERTGGSGATPRPAAFTSQGKERATPEPQPAAEPFRLLQRNLIETSFSGKLFVKQGSIYSYTGNLTFWVKDKRRSGTPALVIVSGSGKVLLTDQEREIKISRVEGPVALRPYALLACQDSLTPRYFTIGDDGAAPEFLSLEGRGLIALSVGSRLLTLNVTPDQPVAVTTSAIIMWAGELRPYLVRDDALRDALVSKEAKAAPLIRLEGTGRVLMEQAV